MAETTTERTLLLSGYQLRLATYEGPLDVLLRLIERSQLAIADVSLIAVTGQFLAFIDEMSDAPAEIVADFTAVGARLTVLKSRSLLPKPNVPEEDLDQSDITVLLREYKQIKDIARQLGDVHAAGLHAYTTAGRGAVISPGNALPSRLAFHEPELLIRSLRRRLGVVPKGAQVIRQRRVVNLREVVSRISELVSRNRTLRFSTVAYESRTRTDAASAFLAVLILVRRQSIVASQPELFGDIDLETPEPSRLQGRSSHVREDEFTN